MTPRCLSVMRRDECLSVSDYTAINVSHVMNSLPRHNIEVNTGQRRKLARKLAVDLPVVTSYKSYL